MARSRWHAALSSWGWRTPEPGSSLRDLDAAPVRDAMLALLQPLPGAPALRLARAVRTTDDLQALWHMRGAVLQAISVQAGELRAREQLAALDAVFLRIWPGAPVTLLR